MGLFRNLFGSKESNSGNVLEIGADLSLDQKWAIICFEVSLSSLAKGERERRETQKLIGQEGRMLNVNPRDLMHYVSINKDPRVIVEKLKSIDDRGLLDQIAYTCFGIACLCKTEDAMNYYTYTFEQLGYSEDDLIKLVQKVELMGKMMGGC